MEPVDPLPVQVGQGFPVLGRSQCLGLEPSHLRGRGRLRIDGTATHDLTHDQIEGQAVGVIHILISDQPPGHDPDAVGGPCPEPVQINRATSGLLPLMDIVRWAS